MPPTHRDHTAMKTRGYAEQVMSRDYTADVNQFLAERLWMADYKARIDEWGSVFGKDAIDIRLFEPKTFESSLEEYFLRWVSGAWDSGYRASGTTNVSVPRDLVEYKRVLNKRWNRDYNATIRSWLEQLADASPNRFKSLGKYYLSGAMRRDLLARNSEGNRCIAQEYFGREQLFEDERLPEIETPSEFDLDKFANIARFLTNNIAAEWIERGKK